LTESQALEALALFEEVLASGEDAVFQNVGAAADGFCAFAWFIATTLLELREAVTDDDVLGSLEDTLAFHQLDEDTKLRWKRVAAASLESFRETPSEARGRWARTGTTLPTARILEQMAAEILALSGEVPPGPIAEIALLLGDGRLTTLLGLSENRAKGFKARRTDPADERIEVDVLQLVTEWVSGSDLDSLAESHLTEVSDDDYRSEQLSEFVTSAFEHHVPWLLGLLVNWLNRRFEAAGSDARFSEMLPGLVHYGVPNRTALELMRQGMRSRRFAIAISRTYDTESDPPTLRDWLARTELGHWRTEADASPTELADLLTFVRAPGAQLVADVLEGREGVIRTTPVTSAQRSGDRIEIARRFDEPAPHPLAVTVGGEVLAHVRNDHHDHVSQLLETGLPVQFEVDDDDHTRLLVTLVDLAGGTDEP
jgi:hypothetical protein